MPPARAVFITSGRHGILLLYFGDSTGGRGAAFNIDFEVIGSIVDNHVALPTFVQILYFRRRFPTSLETF